MSIGGLENVTCYIIPRAQSYKTALQHTQNNEENQITTKQA